MILVYMDRRDSNLYYGSKQHHLMGVDIKITGGGINPHLDTMLEKWLR